MIKYAIYIKFKFFQSKNKSTYAFLLQFNNDCAKKNWQKRSIHFETKKDNRKQTDHKCCNTKVIKVLS